MMEESPSRGESPSGDSNLSGKADQNATMDERVFPDIGGKNSLTNLRTPPTKKAKRIRFFRNGDKFYTGVVMAVTPERYRSFDSLTTDLTRALVSSVTLPNGVRSIYSMDGKKIQNIIDLEDGKSYVVSGQGELFKKVDYTSTKVRRGNSLSGLPQSPAGTVRQIITIPPFIKARIITIIRHGTKPRKVLRLLINKRNAASLDHVFEAITEVVKLDCGAVRRVYTLSGKLVIGLEQLFESEEVFLAYGNDKSTQEDFELDIEESKYVQSFRRGPFASKRQQNGPMPVMPTKTGKRITAVPQIRTPSPSSLILPQPLRLQYSVGHVIGDGNFAVVRHCTHKTTSAEYAIKIVDKYKCQGKETMLASEVDILRQVCHPNIISLIGDQETTDQLFLVMELVKGGDLFDAIAAVTKFSEPEASVMLGHLTSALAYLHSHQIVHRDIKPENLLVEMEGSHVRCLKLGDFGLAQYVTEPLYTVCGTPTYVAPEILAETGYGLKIDVWAAGVILYILLCGFPPFVSPEHDQEELFERILSGQYEFTQPYWDPISLTVKELIANMLQTDPELRFTAEDVLDHPWLTRFLGGEQNPGGNSAADESSQQYGNKQCQPMRLTTYEFTTTKQRCHSSSNIENTSGSNVTSTTSGNRGFDVPFINEIKQNEKNNSRTTSTDKLNRNIIEKSLSLKTDYKNIITTSLNNLMINDDERINSISENIHSMTYSNENGFKKIPITSNLHSYNKKMGNSLSNIHSSIVSTTATTTTTTTTSSSSSIKSSHNNKEFLLPKFSKTACKRNNDLEKKISNNINNKDKQDKYKINKNINKLSKEKKSPIKRLSYSTDCLSNSSDNNIETSDSFINIQYANGKKIINNCSSSTQSIDSSESFENINFDTDTYKETTTTNDDKISVNNPKTFNRNSRLCESNIPKFSRIPVMNGQQQLSRVSQNNEKSQINQLVKYREKKNNNSSSQGMDKDKKMSDNRYKRFSCLPQYLGRKKNTADNYRDYDDNDDVVVEDGRKLNEPKQFFKSNRCSLYYTPQLRRKNYDKIDSGRKCLDNKLNNRPMSCKISGESISNSDYHRTDKNEKRRNRKSIIVDTNKN